jgi:D-beta-D-heptose 7-phosphate kinase/D-beta-D-heptose 1-phosphate adenosyltransferase
MSHQPKIDISKFADCRLLVVGDLMIDEYVWGDVDRISPEAPVQVVAVNNEDYTLGGSGNVVNNLVALGAEVSVLGVVGSGNAGNLLLNKLAGLGSNIDGIVQEKGRPTTKKTRIIAEHQQVLRIDRETRRKVAPDTFRAIVKRAEAIIPDVDGVIISDYGKGLVTRELIVKLIEAARANDKLTIADPKGLDFSKYAGISILTPNKKEASLASGIEITDDQSLAAAGRMLLERTGIDNLLITCGKDGMVFFEPGHQPYIIRAKAREVYDVSGAGDTVIAVLGLGIAAGLHYDEAVSLANTAAGIVVGKVGTATVTPGELSRALEESADSTVSKHKTVEELADICRRLRNDRKQIVLTNGCFDLLHVGHIQLFSASKKFGDVLIVALDDDESVKRIKGADRPVISAAERVGLLSALDSVDYVTVFDTDNLEQVITSIRPDVLTKGSNYESEAVEGREIVDKYGGRVELIPITENISSTRIIDDIKNRRD